jgi:hypothetical protein
MPAQFQARVSALLQTVVVPVQKKILEDVQTGRGSPPMITPFDNEGDVDFAGLERLVGFLAQHVQGLLICGSYGSDLIMSVAERKKVAETTRKIAGEETVWLSTPARRTPRRRLNSPNMPGRSAAMRCPRLGRIGTHSLTTIRAAGTPILSRAAGQIIRCASATIPGSRV